MKKFLKEERGYSLVEVLVAIVILVVAVIPMVKMFDVGLKTATTSSNYDKARSLANKQVEIAQNLGYENVMNDFPCVPGDATCAPPPFEDGTATSPDNKDTDSAVYSNFTFDVEKQYVEVDPPEDPTDNELRIIDTNNSYSGMIRLKITVNWNGGTYTTNGVVTE